MIEMSAFEISRRHPRTATARWVKIEVAHKDAWIFTFADERGALFSWVQLARALAKDEAFQELWNQTWADLPFDFEWKPVPIHPYTARTHPFFAIAFPAEFRTANSHDFRRYLDALGPQEMTATFQNFSGDADLVVPRDVGTFGHIGAFCRTAPREMQRALWRQVGEMCLGAIAQRKPVWCNTHGHGVPWLHVRFDSRLKYSAFPPRGNITANSQAVWYQVYQDTL